MRRTLLNILQGETGLSEERILQIANNPDEEYKRYKIRQGKKLRQIEEPKEELKALQTAYLPLLVDYPLDNACVARPGLGVADNARVHTGARYLLKVDIKGCYQAIRYQTTMRSFPAGEWWSIVKSGLKLGFCRQSPLDPWMLPTGAPTSPILCNIALTPLDKELSAIAREENYRYTRYLDDMIFSTTAARRKWSLIDEVTERIRNHGYKPNQKKTRWLTRDTDVLAVTGVSVGRMNAASREIKRSTRTRLFQLAMAGLPIDQYTQGYLAYIKSIDEYAYVKLLNYYQRKRREYEIAQQQCARAQQILHGDSSNER